MALTTNLPPQAYTRDTLVKAIEWLSGQPSSVRERASSADLVVSYYMQACRKAAVQNVIEAFIAAGFFHCDQIVRLFDHADHRAVAIRRGAKCAGIDVGKVIALIAEDDLLLYFEQRIDQTFDVRIRPPQNPKRQPLGGLVSYSRQAFEFID